MREDICSIPISEVFEVKTTCPICSMREMLETRMAEYITGAAMMEPDVRVMTNKLGFCKTHFDQILEKGSRLSVALILESLLDETKKDIISSSAKKTIIEGKRRDSSCFVCENIDKNMLSLCSNMLILWQKEEDFRKLYSEQSHICAKHYPFIIELAQKKIPKKNVPAFTKVTTQLFEKKMDEIKGDITHFCRMFDYRNAGGDWGNSKDSIERAIEFLTTRKVKSEVQD